MEFVDRQPTLLVKVGSIDLTIGVDRDFGVMR